jgi:hypothetical protein
MFEVARGGGEVAALNMFLFLRMLVGDPYSGFTPSELAKDRDLVLPAWEIASRVRPQARMRDQVERVAAALRTALDAPDAFALPRWPDSVNENGGGAPEDSAPVLDHPDVDGPGT